MKNSVDVVEEKVDLNSVKHKTIEDTQLKTKGCE